MPTHDRRLDRRALAAMGRGLDTTCLRRLGRLAHRASRTSIVTFSAAIVAGMVASVVASPMGGHVLAQDGYGKRDRDAGIIQAVLFGTDEPAQAPAAASWRAHPLRSRPTDAPRQSPLLTVRWRRPQPVVHVASNRKTPDEADNTLGRPGGHNAVCVRLCDGFYFPMGDIGGQADVDSRTSLCAGLCPGAPTRLFVTPSSGDMDRATSISTGQSYASLPVAFAHTKEVGPTCTCHAVDEDQATMVSPLTDITMRSGDSIMTPHGWRVFQGAEHWPYRREDFTPIRSAHNLSARTRSMLVQLEDANLRRFAAGGARPLLVTPRMHLAASTSLDRITDGPAVRRTGQETFGAP